MIPLFFQVVLKDTPSAAGARLAIPALATPIGALVSGVIMSRWGHLSTLVRVGSGIMVLGNALVATLQYHDSAWKHFLYLIPANFGQGMVYPAILFTFLAAFDHSRKYTSYFPDFPAANTHILLEQAVSTSMVYLFRSMGTVWGVSLTSSIVQNILANQLPDALSGIPEKEKVTIIPLLIYRYDC
jgi:hypothetical protein